ncbi:hypothetical protein GQ602_005522 [Ophiocordyceps camponoti-floridani]|uniref:Uncharacterized protein n=1 Tax=Ophiocordyceps camponoti-floridani TaxID=2030778 RepID=A0A8H4Q3I0_9HYPO|nr:hypothetical protein GQ602_005522 [Ophiocordyceps camponoti-floridani]
MASAFADFFDTGLRPLVHNRERLSFPVNLPLSAEQYAGQPTALKSRPTAMLRPESGPAPWRLGSLMPVFGPGSFTQRGCRSNRLSESSPELD